MIVWRQEMMAEKSDSSEMFVLVWRAASQTKNNTLRNFDLNLSRHFVPFFLQTLHFFFFCSGSLHGFVIFGPYLVLLFGKQLCFNELTYNYFQYWHAASMQCLINRAHWNVWLHYGHSTANVLLSNIFYGLGIVTH